MPIELPCSGCGQQLRVRDEDAGRQARCPQCGAITSVPPSSPQGSIGPTPSPEPQPSVASTNPYSPPPSFAGDAPYPSSSPNFGTPHRGTTILVLGILGVTCCFICAPIAWIMGSTDMKAINNGTMDPTGKTQTQVGMILGIIGTLLGGCGIIVQILALVAQNA